MKSIRVLRNLVVLLFLFFVGWNVFVIFHFKKKKFEVINSENDIPVAFLKIKKKVNSRVKEGKTETVRERVPYNRDGYFPLQVHAFPEKEENGKLNVCSVLFAFTNFGGIESWMKTVIRMINLIEGYQFYGVFVWGVIGNNAPKYFFEEKVVWFSSIDQIFRGCHIVLNSVFHHLENEGIFDVLVIHGSSLDPWTMRYSQFYQEYDSVVGVSDDSGLSILKEHVDRYHVIPSLVIQNFECPGRTYRFCEKQLLFVGRISVEKRPELFCRAVCDLQEKGYCGVILGPYYSLNSKFICNCRNIFYMGAREDSQCFMRNSDFVLVPSAVEGGPIVAIEAWMNKIPVVMKGIGLGKKYAESFIIYDWDEYNRETLVDALNSVNIDSLLIKSYSTYLEKFSRGIISKKWENVLGEGVKKLNERGFILKFGYKHSYDMPIDVKKQGKSLKVNCLSHTSHTKNCSLTVDIITKERIVCFKLEVFSFRWKLKLLFGDEKVEIGKRNMKKRMDICLRSKIFANIITFQIPHSYFEVYDFRKVLTVSSYK